jgi:hypothetical protein
MPVARLSPFEVLPVARVGADRVEDCGVVGHDYPSMRPPASK